MISVQVAAYGSMASLLGVLALGTVGVYYYDISSMADVKMGMKSWGQSWRAPIQAAVEPLKRSLSGWVTPRNVDCEATPMVEHNRSDFSNRMSGRFSGR